ncbi:MAG: hypothetical protein AAGI38_15860 [Bacteroidota bacterium]
MKPLISAVIMLFAILSCSSPPALPTDHHIQSSEERYLIGEWSMCEIHEGNIAIKFYACKKFQFSRDGSFERFSYPDTLNWTINDNFLTITINPEVHASGRAQGFLGEGKYQLQILEDEKMDCIALTSDSDSVIHILRRYPRKLNY